MSGIRDLLGSLQRSQRPGRGHLRIVSALTKSTRGIADPEREIRRLIGGDLPRGTALVRVICGGCGTRIATIETDHDGQFVTLWRGRRFPGIPNVECSEHGRLSMTIDVLGPKVDAARRNGKPANLRTRPLR